MVSNEINAEVYQQMFKYLKAPLLKTQREAGRNAQLEQKS